MNNFFSCLQISLFRKRKIQLLFFSRSSVRYIRSWHPPLIISFPSALFHKRLYIHTCARDARITERESARERCRRGGDYYRVNERAVIGCGEPPTPTGHRRSFATLASTESTDRHVQFENEPEQERRTRSEKERGREGICLRVCRVIVGKYDDVATNPARSGTYASAGPD